MDASHLSYTLGLGDFQMTSILYRAVFNADILQCNLPVHSGGGGEPSLVKIIPTSVPSGE